MRRGAVVRYLWATAEPTAEMTIPLCPVRIRAQHKRREKAGDWLFQRSSIGLGLEVDLSIRSGCAMCHRYRGWHR
jgi:hypothetical protein